MAEEQAVTTDYATHLRTYHAFLTITKYGTVTVVVILILMAMFLL